MARPAPQHATALLRIESMWQVPGCMRGAHAPLAFARLAIRDAVHWSGILDRAAVLLELHVPGCVSKVSLQASAQEPVRVLEKEPRLLGQLLALLGGLSTQIGLPALDAPQAMTLPTRSSDGASRWMLALAGYSPRATGVALAWLVRWINDVSQSGEASAWSSERRAELDALLDKLNHLAPLGNNARHFVRAAHERGIPWLALPSGMIQYGWGNRARWLHSTFTDKTPNLAARIARDKLAGNAVLRQAGIPVPPHRRVKTVETAIEAAQSLGYPIVVKPANLDGGHGVSAGLATAEDVCAAFKRAARHSRDILVEKHVEGRDYRIIVGHGKVLWAIERVPAGVTGDGAHSVRELIEQTNRDPRRTARRWGQMKPLNVDEEARGLLEEQGMTLDTVPSPNCVVRLRRAANISSGGTPIPVFDVMHPDNAALAVRAARVMRLDIAGIDLITPDIARSWREMGGVICEVNGQPQLSVTAPHIYGQLFDALLVGQGRIATGLVLSTGDATEIVLECSRILAGQKLCVGMSTPDGLFVGGECVRSGRRSPFADVRSLLIDPLVDAVMLVADGKEFLSTGLPFDRFDVLAIADWNPAPQDSTSRRAQPLLHSVLGLVTAHCSGLALMTRGHSEVKQVVRHFGQKRVERASSQGRLAVRLAQLLLRNHDAYGRSVAASAASKPRSRQPRRQRLAS